MAPAVLEQWFNRVWYEGHPLGWVLIPLGWLFCLLVAARRLAYRAGIKRTRRFPVPVVVVGNLGVGGTGKTPLVVRVVDLLRQNGWQPAIVTRGYRGTARHWPQQVRADSDPVAVGDEPVLLARRAACPVAAAPARNAAIESLLRHADCDVIVSDDGLQHLAMARDVEIVVVDGVRRFGNERCLPAGPLREALGRLDRADMIVSYGMAGPGEFAMRYRALTPRSVRDPGQLRELDTFRDEPVHALAGIGEPSRFFQYLRRQGLQVIAHPFPDHHDYVPGDLLFGDALPVLMTEKDAVKCRPFAPEHAWFVPIEAELPPAFATRLLLSLRKSTDG